MRIGMLVALSGPFASLGENLVRGLELALAEVNAEVAGRQLAVHVEDSAGNPDQALAKARQLVERDRVHVLAGVTLSSEAGALRDYVVSSGVPLIVSNAGLPGLTRDPNMRSSLIFRVSFANGQHEAPFGRYAYEKLGFRRVVLTGLDYSAGHDKVGAFGKHFQAAGGTIVGEVYAPVDTTDYGPYLQRIAQYDADGVFAFYSGVDAVRFVQQYAEFGIEERIPLFGSGDTVDESILQEQGEAALGYVSSSHYAVLYDSPENQELVRRTRERYGVVANQFVYQGYVTGRVLVEALAAVEGAIEDTARFLEALRAVRFRGPTGEFRFHPESQGAIITVFIRRVERLPSGELGNVVLDVIPEVDDVSF
ncbi:ABC transporter substrate-binding protein [Thermomicrobium sp. 4228-Ro]|uniref:ABC transporter substrate-binding protein n=1 Tax=Thermomicrobium sp. 4228-Ro TaxID=2993937 RepID=UPI002248A704|nr:ABC transporter substrate-binding protein [Thermomicrobium sp. 4228-Ro]MCX2727217.1 ABC transporter substrate-binding protein [Thermomicrobium sp. 4228-Ro]